MVQLPLSILLVDTAKVCRQVLSGKSLTVVLSKLPSEHKAGVQALSFFVMRYLSRGQALSAKLLNKKAPNLFFASLLDLSLCVLSAPYFVKLAKAEGFTHGCINALPHYDEYTLVNQAVAAASVHKKTQSFKSLLNACLRSYLRQAEQLTREVWQQEAVRYAFPQWWIEHLRAAYPTQWQALLGSANQPGPMSLRVNRRQISRDAFLQVLSEHGIEVVADYAGAHVKPDDVNRFSTADAVNAGTQQEVSKLVVDDAVVLQQAMPVQIIPGFEQGWFSVQDIAAQQAVEILPLFDGARVLDACAAPGGKTAHLLERYNLNLTALDIDEKRLQKVTENLQRLKLDINPANHINLKAVDVTDLDLWYDGEQFDVVIADVPCSASGIVRRHPDIKWLRQPQDIKQLVAIQRQIVADLWQAVKPDGYLLYITCSVFPEENEQQAKFMLNHLQNIQRLSAPGQLLPLPAQENEVKTESVQTFCHSFTAVQDGFFYALFKKQNT